MPAGFCGGLGSFLMPSFSSELSKIHSFSFALAIPRLSHLTKKPKSDSGRPDNASIAAAKVAEGARSTVKPAGHRAEFRNLVHPGRFRWPYQLRPLKGPDGLVEASNPELDQESLMLETQQVLVDLEQVVSSGRETHTKSCSDAGCRWAGAAAAV